MYDSFHHIQDIQEFSLRLKANKQDIVVHTFIFQFTFRIRPMFDFVFTCQNKSPKNRLCLIIQMVFYGLKAVIDQTSKRKVITEHFTLLLYCTVSTSRTPSVAFCMIEHVELASGSRWEKSLLLAVYLSQPVHKKKN